MSTSVVLKQNQGYLSTLPVGSIIAWHRDLLGKDGFHLPPGWVPCDGQKLDDEESILNGHTIPNLNGEGRFIRGGKESGVLQNQDWKSFTVAGFSQGLYTHGDVLIPKEGYNTTYPFGGKWESVPGSGGYVANQLRFKFDDSEVRPLNMSVIWIMKVKQTVVAQALPVVMAEPDAPEGAIYVDKGGNVGIGKSAAASALTVNGPLVRNIQMATGLGPNDGTDNGQIKSRVLKIKKLFKDTAIRIFYCDNLRVNGNNIASRWEIRVNGSAPPGGAIYQDMYGSTGNYHHPSMIMGYATGLPAGEHEIQVWVSPAPGYAASDAYTGWNNSRWTLEAQEVSTGEKVSLGKIDWGKVETIPIDWGKVDWSKVDVSGLDMSKIDASKLDVSKLDTSAIDTSKLDASKLDVSKIDASALDTSKLDASKLDATKIDTSKIDATKLDVSKIDLTKLGG